jgi:ActR/RegA family two-component response regulator
MRNVILLGIFPQFLEKTIRVFERVGYNVCTASSLRDAARLATTPTCDAVVIGPQLAENERSAFTRALRLRPELSHIICVYVGSSHNAEPADAVLQASCSVADLVQSVIFLVELAESKSVAAGP